LAFESFAPRRIGLSLLLMRYDRAGIDDRLGEGAREGKQRGVRPAPRELASAVTQCHQQEAF